MNQQNRNKCVYSITRKKNFSLAIMLVFFIFNILNITKAQEIPVNKEFPKTQFREEILLNGVWDFKADVDTVWTKIRVPGSYSISRFWGWDRFPWDGFKYPERWTKKGAVYQREFELPANIEGKIVTFYCGAACFHTETSVNGKKVGEFHDGFFPFEFQINNALTNVSSKNMLTLKVSGKNEDTFSGESNWNRGIQEDTYLKIYPEVYVDPNDIVVKTFVSKNQIELGIRINNSTNKPQKVFVRNFITDVNDKVVKIFDGGWTDVPANQSLQQKMTDNWPNAHIWTLHDPYLYHVHTVLYNYEGKAFDKNTQRFGFREITINKQHIYLNGKELFLRGNGSHDLGDIQGTREYVTQWLTEMKSRGINILRMHIYPRHTVLYEVADELGMLIEAEAAFFFQVPKSETVWKGHLDNLVKYERNHPSVILWSVSNELRWNGGGEKKYLIDYMKGLDDTRPIFSSDFSLESKYGDVLGHHYNAITVFDEWKEFGPDKPMIWDELGNVWEASRPLDNGTAGREVTSQDWATGTWRDGHDMILNDIEGMIDGQMINGELHRVNLFIPWDLTYVFFRWQPTNKARDLWFQHDDLTSKDVKIRLVQNCASTVNIWDKTLPVYEPNPGFYLFEKHLRSVRFFDSDDYCSYFGGTNIIKTSKLYYEDLRDADAIHCNIETHNGQILTSQIQKFVGISGQISDNITSSFTLPNVNKVIDVNLVRHFYNKGIAGFKDTLAVKIYPPVKSLLSKELLSTYIAVVNNQKIADYLKNMGLKISSFQISNSDILNKYQFIIANNSLEFNVNELSVYLKNGGKLLLLNSDTKESEKNIVRKSSFIEDFNGSNVADLEKGGGSKSLTTGLKWDAGYGQVSTSFSFTDVDQYMMLKFNKFGEGGSFVYSKFSDNEYPFIIENFTDGNVNVSFDNNIPGWGNNRKKTFSLLDYSRALRLLVCDKKGEWYLSDKNSVFTTQTKEGKISVNVKDLSWKAVQIKSGKSEYLNLTNLPDLSQLNGVGIWVDPLDASQYTFIIKKLEFKAKSLPAAIIPLNGGMHKLLEGINQADLTFYRNGSGSKILDLPNDNKNFRNVLLGNKDGEGSLLYEEFNGKGIVLNSGLNIVPNLSNEPVASYMLFSLLNYLAKYKIETKPAKTGIIAESETASRYTNIIGVCADLLSVEKLPELSIYKTLIVEGNNLNIATLLNSRWNVEKIRNFVSNGGIVMFTALDDITIGVYRKIIGKEIRLTTPYLYEKSHCIKAAISWTLRDTPKNPVEYYDKIVIPQPFEANYNPVISGLANQDLDWGGIQMFTKGIELEGMDPVVASQDYNILISNWKIDWTQPTYGGEYINLAKDIRRSYWFVNRDPVLFALNNDKGFYIFNQLEWSNDNQKAIKVLRQILTNLGCNIGAENKIPAWSYSFDLSVSENQIERFKLVKNLLLPTTRKYYGSPDELKTLVISELEGKSATKPNVLLLGNDFLRQLTPQISNRMGNTYNVAWSNKNIGRSDSILINLAPFLYKEKNWSLILLCIGYEDIKNEGNKQSDIITEQFTGKIENIIDQLKETKAKLYITTFPPISDSFTEYDRELIHKYNEIIKKTAEQSGVYVYDINDYIIRKYPDFVKLGANKYTDKMKADIAVQIAEAIISFGAAK